MVLHKTVLLAVKHRSTKTAKEAMLCRHSAVNKKSSGEIGQHLK
jgi:hypothetical protein